VVQERQIGGTSVLPAKTETRLRNPPLPLSISLSTASSRAIIAVDNVIAADECGYDACVIGHFQDPGLYEASSAVPIPIIGTGEATMHFLGAKSRRSRASRPHAASGGRTRFAISAPCSRSITAMSYWPCRSSQNCARFPK
jgi:hypothetical protein